MARKISDNDQGDMKIVLLMQGEKFVVSKRLLSDRSEYFKAKFCGLYKDSQETVLTYPDISADAFSKVYDCLFGKAISTDDVKFPDIENSLKIADYFCIDVFKEKLRETLLKSWDTTQDPLKSLKFAEDVFPEAKPVLDSSCIGIAHDIMQTVSPHDADTAYELVHHATQKEEFVNSGVFYNPYRFSECCVNTIKLMFTWLVKNAYSKTQTYELLKLVRLEMFPSTFVTEFIASICANNKYERASKNLLLDCTKHALESIKQTMSQHIQCVYILSSSYNYSKFFTADVADFNRFCPTTWSWQTDKIEISEGSRVIHVHIINRTAYLLTSTSLDIIDLNTMKLECVLTHETLTHFLNNVWVNHIQVLTCHDEDSIHIVPDEPESEFRPEVCHSLRFDIKTHTFTALPHNHKGDMAIRAVLSYAGYVYFAGLTDTIVVYRYDPSTKSYTTLCTVDDQALSTQYELNYLSTSICMGKWEDNLYMFCFSKTRSFYVTVDLKGQLERQADIKTLQNQHFTKGWTFTKPCLCKVKDGFLIALQIHDCTPHPYTWDDILLTLFRPKHNTLELLGLLPKLNNNTGGRFGFGIQPV